LNPEQVLRSAHAGSDGESDPENAARAEVIALLEKFPTRARFPRDNELSQSKT
jgi:hypothetical protein